MTFMCLAYHRITDEPDVPFAVTTERFRRDMERLYEGHLGGNTIGCVLDCDDEFFTRVALSFDDGTIDFIENAKPILGEFGFNATIFVIPGLSGQLGTWPEAAGIPLMTAVQISELSALGFEIGSHSATHKALLAVDWPSREIEGSFYSLGGRARGFSYPFGQYNSRIETLVAMHYDYAVSCDPRLCDGTLDRYHLGRFVMDMNHEPDLSLLS